AVFTSSCQRTLQSYACSARATGVLALHLHAWFYMAMIWWFAFAAPERSGPFTAQLLRLALSAILTIPIAALIGATFSLITTAVLRHCPGNYPGQIPTLFFASLLGASVAVYFERTFLLGSLGLSGTLIVPALLSLAFGGTVYMLFRRRNEPAAPTDQARHSELSGRGSRRLYIGTLLF